MNRCTKKNCPMVGVSADCDLKDCPYRTEADQSKGEDLIKRSDAVRALNREKSDWNCDYNVPIDNCIKRLNKVKSADRPSGEWLKFGLGRGTRILFCTNCERRIEVPLSQGDSNYNFCPNCGADMRERKESE